jgi:SAM-dependent methyltransferase
VNDQAGTAAAHGTGDEGDRDAALRYPADYQEMASTGRAVHLVRTAGLAPGVVLDLGCGAGAVAEPLRDLGFEYVGADVDTAGLADLERRGFEAHELDLSLAGNELADAVVRLLGGRPLAAVLCLDVLEHLAEPAAALQALRAVVLGLDEGTPAPLVVSIPNITHRDVAAKLLLGRWDLDDGGLLDDTHLRFFSEDELARLLQVGGWAVEAAADVIAEISDQCYPVDAPTLRPGAPLRELLASVRQAADASATTYQFVRRLRPAAEGPRPAPHHHVDDEALPLLGAFVLGDQAGAAALLADLEAQVPAGAVVPVATPEELGDALRRHAARLVVVLDAASRVSPGWAAAVAAAVPAAPGRVLQVPVTLTDGAPGDASGWATAAPTEVENFDPLHVIEPRPVLAAAFVVPGELARTAGVVPPAGREAAEALVVWLARAVMLCGVTRLDGPPLVAAPAARAVDGPAAHEAWMQALDAEPLLLPPGALGRLAVLRRRVVRAEAQAAQATHQARAAEASLASISLHLRGVDDELARVRPEIDRLRAEHARRPSRRLAAALRRAFG